ncbi:T9SS sorting signal type C domain-containing protein [Flavobacterium rhizosphaerae]
MGRIYVKDKLAGVVHELTESNYQFTTESGEFDDRFEIVYQTESLSTKYLDNKHIIFIYKNNNTINIDVTGAVINNVELYDIHGRKLYKEITINKTQHVIREISPQQQLLLVSVTTNKGQTVKKIIY